MTKASDANSGKKGPKKKIFAAPTSAGSGKEIRRYPVEYVSTECLTAAVLLHSLFSSMQISSAVVGVRVTTWEIIRLLSHVHAWRQ